jgi:hypothetical protein
LHLAMCELPINVIHMYNQATQASDARLNFRMDHK